MADKKRKYRNLEEFEYPEGCKINFDLKIIDLFKELKKNDPLRQRMIDEYYRIKNDIGRRPLRKDIYEGTDIDINEFLKRKHDGKKGYLRFLASIDELNEEEKNWLNSIAEDFLYELEKTSMSKSYKIPTLLALIKDNKLQKSVNMNKAGKTFERFYRNHKRHQKDLNNKKHKNWEKWNEERFVKEAERNPVKYLSKRKYFIHDEINNEFMLNPDLHRFLSNTAQHFCAERLKLRFDETGESLPEHEPFDLDGLETYKAQEALLAPLQGHHLPNQPAAAIEAAGQRLLRSGQLPVANLGQLTLKNMRSQANIAARRWQAIREEYSDLEPPQEIFLQRDINTTRFLIEDWSDGLYRNADNQLARLVLKAGDVNKKKIPHYPRLLNDWVQHLVLNASGLNVSSRIIGHDGQHHLLPLPTNQATEYLDAILQAWIAGLEQPLPLPTKTVFAHLKQVPPSAPTTKELAKTYESAPFTTGELDYANSGAWRRSFPNAAGLLEPTIGEKTLFSFWAARLYQPLIEHLNAEPKA